MKKEDKKNYLSVLVEELKEISGVILTEYQGLNVSEMTQLRRELKQLGSRYVVVKNTIAALALEKTGRSDLVKCLTGPTAIIILNGDPLATAKKLVKFAKEHEKLKIKLGYMFDKVTTPEEITEISKLPSKEIALGQLVNVLQSPVCALVNVLQASVAKFVYLIEEIKNKRG